MSIPSRRVTDAEMAVKSVAVLKKLMDDRGLTPEEFARRVRETPLPANPMRPFGLAVQAERKARNMSRKQLASKAGLTPRFVMALERGFLKDLSLAAFFNIAFALGVSPEHLVEKSGWTDFE
jgi:hypothetical protein